MGFQRNLDYIDVATRLTEMRKVFPDLSMQQVKIEFVSIGQKDYVVYTAAAFRTPDDLRPGVGTAWEPIPGPTPYTKDSEVQNAETAAWGRALVAIGASTKNGIASVEEVTNRSGNELQEVTSDNEDINVILKAAEQSDDEFLNSLATQFRDKGRLSDKQIGSGVKKAMTILTTPRSAPGSEDERPWE